MGLSEQNPLVSQVSNVFENKIFKEVIKLKWGSWSRTAIPYDWCPCKKKKRYTEYTVKANVKTQQDGRHLQAKERGSEEATPALTLILGIYLWNYEKWISIV